MKVTMSSSTRSAGDKAARLVALPTRPSSASTRRSKTVCPPSDEEFINNCRLLPPCSYRRYPSVGHGREGMSQFLAVTPAAARLTGSRHVAREGRGPGVAHGTLVLDV